MSIQLPLISCVCVTRKKPELLQRAIACFLAQTYQNKELVIIYEDDDAATERLVERGLPAEMTIRVFRVPSKPKAVLGELRNYSIRAANGDFICQWDDDDWYHMNRLSEQYGSLHPGGHDGSIMTQWLVFDSLEKKAYISNLRLWEGSILCKKSVLLLKPYEHKTLGEDTATVDYIAALGRLQLLNKMPFLYIYVYHGHNTWNYEHWNAIFRCSTALSAEDSLRISDILHDRHPVHEGSLSLNRILERVNQDNRMLL